VVLVAVVGGTGGAVVVLNTAATAAAAMPQHLYQHLANGPFKTLISQLMKIEQWCM
jgi:hypothetical protein